MPGARTEGEGWPDRNGAAGARRGAHDAGSESVHPVARVTLPFADRVAAGDALAVALRVRPELMTEDPVIAALPRGGVPVAAPVARALGAPLDVIVVRKLGVPRQPELAMGAIGEGGVRVLERDVVNAWSVSAADLAAVETRERDALERRLVRLRAGRPGVPLGGRAVIVVDDGFATGSTARAAVAVARAEGATSVVLAAPVAPPTTVAALSRDADAVVCVAMPAPFAAIGQWYVDFSPTSDDDVVGILEQFDR
jgi:predicted phosphoribosyltransferase